MAIIVKKANKQKPKKEKQNITSPDKGMEKLESSYTVIWNAKFAAAMEKKNYQLLRKLNIKLPNDPAIPDLSVYPAEIKTYVPIKTCIQIFIRTLFLIAPKWKQYPSTDECINNTWNIHTIINSIQP